MAWEASPCSNMDRYALGSTGKIVLGMTEALAGLGVRRVGVRGRPECAGEGEGLGDGEGLGNLLSMRLN